MICQIERACTTTVTIAAISVFAGTVGCATGGSLDAATGIPATSPEDSAVKSPSSPVCVDTDQQTIASGYTDPSNPTIADDHLYWMYHSPAGVNNANAPTVGYLMTAAIPALVPREVTSAILPDRMTPRAFVKVVAGTAYWYPSNVTTIATGKTKSIVGLSFESPRWSDGQAFFFADRSNSIPPMFGLRRIGLDGQVLSVPDLPRPEDDGHPNYRVLPQAGAGNSSGQYVLAWAGRYDASGGKGGVFVAHLPTGSARWRVVVPLQPKPLSGHFGFLSVQNGEVFWWDGGLEGASGRYVSRVWRAHADGTTAPSSIELNVSPLRGLSGMVRAGEGFLLSGFSTAGYEAMVRVAGDGSMLSMWAIDGLYANGNSRESRFIFDRGLAYWSGWGEQQGGQTWLRDGRGSVSARCVQVD